MPKICQEEMERSRCRGGENPAEGSRRCTIRLYHQLGFLFIIAN